MVVFFSFLGLRRRYEDDVSAGEGLLYSQCLFLREKMDVESWMRK
jgi:hypothetical protein